MRPPSYSMLAWEDIRNKYLIIGNAEDRMNTENRDVSKEDLDETKKYPALIVGAPYGGVKEQGPCVYANELAQRGFVVLTFDQVFMGESGGEPRHVSSPGLFAESFSAVSIVWII